MHVKKGATSAGGEPPYQGCAIPAKVDFDLLPIPDQSPSIPIPTLNISCDFSLRFNSNSTGPENPWISNLSSDSGIGIAHYCTTFDV